MPQARKIKRLCACGCGQVTSPGRRWMPGHNSHKHTKESRFKMSLSQMGNTNSKGKIPSEKSRLKMSLAHIKYNPNYKYCGAWQDKEYIKDLRKDYCENADCKGKYKRLHDHHINLNKKDCKPFNVMTLCCPCHMSLHRKLGKNTDHKNYLIIIRKDRITYTHKRTRKKITLTLKKEK